MAHTSVWANCMHIRPTYGAIVDTFKWHTIVLDTPIFWVLYVSDFGKTLTPCPSILCWLNNWINVLSDFEYNQPNCKQ